MAKVEPLKVIARYCDGRMVKGTTFNLNPSMGWFHMIPLGSRPTDPPVQVALTDLKAVFVVKTFEGHPEYEERKSFNSIAATYGAKLEVVFRDGEVMRGTALDYDPACPAFFLIPTDPQSNNKRVFVIREATKSVRPVQP
jgi:hypothetical protein